MPQDCLVIGIVVIVHDERSSGCAPTVADSTRDWPIFLYIYITYTQHGLGVKAIVAITRTDDGGLQSLQYRKKERKKEVIVHPRL